MATFVMLIKSSNELVKNFGSLEEVATTVDQRCREACPDVTVATKLALLGPFDFLYLVEAPSEERAFRLAAVILSSGLAASVETWTAMHFNYPKMLQLMVGMEGSL